MIPCPVCSRPDTVPLLTLTRMPLLECVFSESRQEALDVECGTIDLVLCPECSHIYNRAFEPERIKYMDGYENALGFSPRHRAYLSEKVDHLIRTYQLQNKSIVEIGCGNADFISLLCDRGGNHGIGYDPSQQSRTFRIGSGSVEVRAEHFTAIDQVQTVDFVCSQHVLEHLETLPATLRRARSILRPEGAGYFEVPDGLAIVRDWHIWDLTYEHVSYFSPMSLRRALSDAGFSVMQVGSSFGGQYLHAEVDLAGDDKAAPTSLAPDGEAVVIKHISAAFSAGLHRWKERMSGLIAGGHRIVVWGAGTKAVSFLNMLGISADKGLEYVVDINPRKKGRFLPGMAQQITSPDFLREYRPEIVVVMNKEYEGEIQSMLESMDLQCDLLIASP